MSKNHSKQAVAAARERIKDLLFWVCASLLALVPLIFSTAVYRTFTLPKFVVLITGSAAILLMVSLIATNDSSRHSLGTLKSRFAALVLLYVVAVASSTFLGLVPVTSLFGSYESEMGLITRFSFLLLFAGLVVATGRDPKRLLALVCVMVVTGSIVGGYALAQFVGLDPFLAPGSYTFNSPDGPITRVGGTLGHSNYLGNFLLYTAPLAASLAIASRGRTHRIALFAALVSAAAIVFSGTRGAWLGLLVGGITFAAIELRDATGRRWRAARRRRVGAAVAGAVVLMSVIVIIASPRSGSIAARVRAFGSDRFTGSGRTLLWRDAIRMVPSFSLIGCGPEAFRRAFLPYKSQQLAISSPTINNESSHNSYLDALISFGVIGAVAYIALIVCAFALLVKSRRRAADRHTRMIITGLISSLAAVCVHNFFIYDQLPTGMYFFALMAIVAIASNVGAPGEARESDKRASSNEHSFVLRSAKAAVVVASVALLGLTVWFSTSLVVGDAAVKRTFDSAISGDFEGLIRHGESATHRVDPTCAYNFMFARALALYVEGQPPGKEAVGGSNAIGSSKLVLREQAIATGKAQAFKSLAHTLAPESTCVLLAYFALQESNTEELHEFAGQAIRWDPNYFNARWLMAEALLAEGDKDGAASEARTALQLRPGNSEAISVLARARGVEEALSPRILGLIERARLLRESHNNTKAQELLTKAIQFSPVACPVCHREMALLCEETNQREKAIAEWKEYTREAPDRAVAEDVASRIANLEQK